jgi:hypothetical protein
VKKIVFYSVFGTIGVIGGLAWPFACFGAIFLLDAPFRGALDAITRFTAIGIILVFPALFALSWKIGHNAVRKDERMLRILWPTVLPLLSPIYMLLYFLVIGPIAYGNA